MSTKRMILYALAGVAGLALAAGDAAAAPPKKVAAPVRHFGGNTATHATTHITTRATTTRNTVRFRGNRTTNKVITTNKGTTTNKVITTNKVTKPTNLGTLQQGPNHLSNQNTAGPNKNTAFQGKFKPGPGKVTLAGNKKFTGPIIKIGNNKIVPIWKGPKKIWVGGHWKVFIPFSALSVVLVGGSYYWPDGYLTVGEPYCVGVTPDGCRLNWQMVNFADGGGAYQCVQFCPRPNAPPPAQAASLVPPPPMPPNGACEITVYAEPNLAGQDATTGDEQPALSQTGWQNAIASIEVKSGVWDFFSDENFSGENMRLRPGTYKDLGPEWTRKINSFNCVMTAAPQ